MAKDNRTVPRITIECPMTYHNVDSPDIKKATALDVSNHGVLFLTDEELTEGSLKEIHIEPEDASIPALNAIIQILRIEAVTEVAGQFKVAGVIKIIK